MSLKRNIVSILRLLVFATLKLATTLEGELPKNLFLTISGATLLLSRLLYGIFQ